MTDLLTQLTLTSITSRFWVSLRIRSLMLCNVSLPRCYPAGRWNYCRWHDLSSVRQDNFGWRVSFRLLAVVCCGHRWACPGSAPHGRALICTCPSETLFSVVSLWRLSNKIYKNPKIPNLQKIPKIQNMNYAIYIYYKIFFFLNFLDYFTFSNFRKYFGIFGLFYTINRYFEYRIRILCI